MKTGPAGASGASLPRRARAEVAAVLATGLLHLLFEEVLHAKLVYIVLAAGAWISYLGWQLHRDRGVLAAWGFRREGLAPTLRVTSLFGSLAVLGLAGLAAARGTFALHWHMAPLAALYPIWGLIQQFLVQALLARNLRDAVPSLAATWQITPIAALAFAVVHWPDAWLMGATFGLGLLFTPVYLRWRNLWPLGLWHGLLGVLAYFWLLGRDPWVEMFGR